MTLSGIIRLVASALSLMFIVLAFVAGREEKYDKAAMNVGWAILMRMIGE